VQGGECVQRHVLYLGEINDSQQAAWQKSIAVLAEGEREPRQVALFHETSGQGKGRAKGDLGVRPIFHHKDHRIEAHIFVAFLAYCLHVTLGWRLHALAPGLTTRTVLEKFASISLLDVQLPKTEAASQQVDGHDLRKFLCEPEYGAYGYWHHPLR
jgi:hypothetical protein